MTVLEATGIKKHFGGVVALSNANLTCRQGRITGLLGANGSGKSTLSNVAAGHPSYEVTDGEVLFEGENLLEMEPEERARSGLFLAFQYPVEIPGVTVANFLKTAHDALAREDKLTATAFIKEMRTNMGHLDMDPGFVNRYLNSGFSGGEKKRMEILQMLMLKPRFAIMDETDSGLDIDALKIVAE